MAKETWGEKDFSPEEWAELEEDIRLSEAEYERGEYVEYGPGDKEAFLAGVIERGRAAPAAEKKGS